MTVFRQLSIALNLAAILCFPIAENLVAQEIPTLNISPQDISDNTVLEFSKPATVRIIKPNSAGSGVIIDRQGNVYSVLTNWHVVESQNPLVLTADDKQHQLVELPQQIGDADLAILQFYSEVEYPVAKAETQMPEVGETVYIAGFPMATANDENTLDWGNRAFYLTQGEISIIPSKSLLQGYGFGYTNDTQPGMSGSPIFNDRGRLIGIHGRGKYRDPAFGVYVFEDGSEPNPEQLERSIESSWGIPINIYLNY